MKHLQTAHAEDSKAMLEIIQSKGEELLRREEEGKTMRLLYESEVVFFFFLQFWLAAPRLVYVGCVSRCGAWFCGDWCFRLVWRY